MTSRSGREGLACHVAASVRVMLTIMRRDDGFPTWIYAYDEYAAPPGPATLSALNAKLFCLMTRLTAEEAARSGPHDREASRTNKPHFVNLVFAFSGLGHDHATTRHSR